MTEATYYRWRAEYGGLKLDQVRRLKQLEQKNTRLRRALSDLTLEKLVLKELDQRRGHANGLYRTGSPWENDYVEGFNGKFREELLAGEVFNTLAEARVLIEQWRQHDNAQRPHSALGYWPPAPEAAISPWPIRRHPEPIGSAPAKPAMH